jgi:hypothetical protein
MSEDSMTLAEAQARLRDGLEEGITCPCCEQFAKIYTRKLHASMAYGLYVFYQESGRAWGFLPDTLPFRQLAGDFAKLRYWGLIEEDTERREDGGHSGMWRITEVGEGWLLGRYTVFSHVRLYDSHYLGLVGKQVTLQDALGKRFRLDELMAS